MPRPPSPPSPHLHTATTIRRATTLPVTRAPDGMVLDHELERRWAAVKARLSLVQRAILEHQPVRTEPQYWADVYTDVANLYNQNDDARKRRMYMYVRDFVKDLVAAQLAHLRKLKGPELLAEYCRTWDVTMDFVRYMKRVLHHLHRFWIRDNANTLKSDPIRPLDKLLMFYWREELLSKLHIVVTIAMELVASDRRGEKVNHEIVKGIVDTLVVMGEADVPAPDSHAKSRDAVGKKPNLNLYIRVFEDEFLALTRAFYKAEGEKMVAVGDVTSFMKSVMARLDEEDERGKRMLHSDSGPRLRQATEEQLIGNNITYLQEEAKQMIRMGREDDLRLVYTLLSRIDNGLAPLRAFFVSYVRAEGNSVVVQHVDNGEGKDDLNSNMGLVRVLIKLYRKHSSLVRRCFDGSSVIMMAIDDAFRGFVNRSLGTISLPTLIAHYVDYLLRRGRKFDREMWDISETHERRAIKQSENGVSGRGAEDDKSVPGPGKVVGATNQIEKSTKEAPESISEGEGKEICKGNKADDEDAISRYISELVRMFMYLDDKDLFFDIHRRLFAKRLMSNHDEELETVFIAKVKTEMGQTFTQRLSGMLKDKLVSDSTRAEFEIYARKKREEFALLRKKGLHTSQSSTALTGGNGDPESRAPENNPIGIIPVANVNQSEVGAGEGGAPMNGTNVRTLISVLSVNNFGLLADAASIAAPSVDVRSTGDMETKGYREERGSKHDVRGETQKECSIIKGISEVREIEAALCIDFNTHVLNALHWPAAKVAELRVPPVLRSCQQLFTDFYMQDKETRKLSWIHGLSSVHLTGRFGNKKYTFVMSTFQACVLLLFNDRDSISIREACELLNISKDRLIEHIRPLILSRKSKLLKYIRNVNESADSKSNEKSTQMENGEGTEYKSVVEQNECTENEDDGSDSKDTDDERQGVNEEVDERAVRLVGSGSRKRKRAEMDKADSPPAKRVHLERGTEVTGIDMLIGNPARSVSQQTENGRGKRTAATAQENKRAEQTKAKGKNKDKDSGMEAEDVLYLNKGFHSRLVRIQVATSIAKVESTETAASKRSIVVDRSTQIDATLVRIMKGKREMTHAALSAEVISALAPMFLPDPRLIKTRIERLIEQEYMERDKNDARLYKYSA